MSRPVHFEIHAADPEKVAPFYTALFGWTFKKWDGPADYWLIDTGDAQPGINGGLVRRKGPGPADGQAVNAFVCTIGVEDLDARLKQTTDLGGTIAFPRMPIPGVGYLAYIKDPDGNLLGMMQADPSAKFEPSAAPAGCAEPCITIREAFTVGGMTLVTDNKKNEIPELWHQFVNRIPSLQSVDRNSYGVTTRFDPATGKFSYMAGVEVVADASLPADVEKWSIPAQTYAVFSCTLGTIKQTYEHIYRAWLPQSREWKGAAGPMFELYDEKFKGGPGGVLYLYVPVIAAK